MFVFLLLLLYEKNEVIKYFTSGAVKVKEKNLYQIVIVY
jgi:hypothetical protein